MPFNLGYACINTVLRNQNPSIYTGRSFTKKTWLTKGLEHADNVILNNVLDLEKIIQWNYENNINVYRITSSLCSWRTEYQLNELKSYNQIEQKLSDIGKLIQQTKQRVSFHPGQFCVLSSPHDHVIDNAIDELNFHGYLMDLLLQPRSHRAKINIHLGGAYNNKQEAIDRFCKNFERLDESVKTRLTVENDDKKSCYSVKDLYEGVYKKIGVPIVFDYHHHSLHDDNLSEGDAAKMAASTWGNIRPVFHYSESLKLEHPEIKTTLRAHSNYVNGPVDDHGLDFDLIIEAKQKEQAVFKLIENMNKLGLNKKIETPNINYEF